MGNGVSMIFLIIIFGGMLFFMTRSTKKQQQEHQKRLNSMKIGDNVITIGGLHGVINEVNEKTVFIDCEGIILEFEKAAIRTVTPGTSASVATDNTVTTPEVDVPKEENDVTKETEK